MANSLPRPAIHERGNEELLEDLCLELRHVGCRDGDLPHGERVVAHVRLVCAVHAELATRRVDYGPRLKQLSEETGWQMPALLDDCLAYPQRVPYVRDPDGIRRHLRCHLCSTAERPPDARIFWFCEDCLGRVLGSVQQRAPCQGIILFRTYNAECRCAHAKADTVLATDTYGEVIFGVCEKCIRDELERRRAA